jgi:hypothetical protein
MFISPVLGNNWWSNVVVSDHQQLAIDDNDEAAKEACTSVF